MSFVEDHNTIYSQLKRNRKRIGIALWNNNLGLKGPPEARCEFCLERWRLEIRESPNGKIGVCIRGCGNTFQLKRADLKGEILDYIKYQPKYTTKFGKQTRNTCALSSLSNISLKSFNVILLHAPPVLLLVPLPLIQKVIL